MIRQVIVFHETYRAEVDRYVAKYRADLDRQEANSVPGPGVLGIRRLMAEQATSGESAADS